MEQKFHRICTSPINTIKRNVWFQWGIYIYPLNGNLLKLKKCWLATNIDFTICNIHSNLDRWIIIVEQNLRLQGSMHPVKFPSRGRGGGLWWPAGLLFQPGQDCQSVFYVDQDDRHYATWSEVSYSKENRIHFPWLQQMRQIFSVVQYSML